MARRHKHDEGKVDLDAILDEIDPKKVNEKVELKHREARNKFQTGIQVKSYNEFMDQITKYMQHHHKEVYGSEMPKELAFSQARQFLDAMYKKQGGFVGAFNEAKHGNLNKVLDSLADAIEHEHRLAYVNHVMSRIDPQDFNTHVKLMDQYKTKYKSLLSEDFQAKSSEELARDYDGLIKEHAELVHGKKSQLKKYKPAEPEEQMREAA